MDPPTSSRPSATGALLDLLKAPAFIPPHTHPPTDLNTANSSTLPPSFSSSPAFSPAAFLDAAFPSFSPSPPSLPSLPPLLSLLQQQFQFLSTAQSTLLSTSLPHFKHHSALLHQRQSAFHSLTSSYTSLRQSLTSDLSSLSPLTSSLSSLLSNSLPIQRTHLYLLLIQACEDSFDAARAQAETAPSQACQSLLSLSRLYQQVKEERPRCVRLERLLHHRILHLLHLTQSTLTTLYSTTLTALQWPQTGQGGVGGLLQTTNEGVMESFTEQTQNLLLLQIEAETTQHPPGPSPLQSLPPTFAAPSPPSAPPSLWIFDLLFQPIHIRFRYHFSGDRPTHRLDKPEWYLSFITAAINIHRPFLTQYVQPLFLRSPLSHVDPAFALIHSLLTLVREQVKESLPQLMERPVLFRHLVDELLGFEGRLRGEWEYPEQCEGVMGVLVGAEGGGEVFEKWLSVDKEWVNDRLNAMREMKDPWQRINEGSEGTDLMNSHAADVDSDDEDVADVKLDPMDSNAAVDDEGEVAEEFAPPADVDAAAVPSLIVTRSAHQLVSLVSSITTRFTLLPSLAARLRFVQDLQYQLLDIYLEWLEEEGARLLSSVGETIASPSTSVRQYCMLINSLHYVESVLMDWSDSVTFIELRYYQAHSDLPADLTTAQLVERLAASQPGSRGGGEVDGSVFDAMIANYHDVREKMIKGIVDAVIDCFDALTRTYRRLGHQDVMTDDDTPLSQPSPPPASAGPAGSTGLRVDAPLLTVSPSFVGALVTLKLQLLTFSRHLSSPLMAVVWQRVASRVDSLLFATVVRERYFSVWGARQLAFDLRALLGIFKGFTPSPSRWLGCVNDACVVMGYGGKEREEMEREIEGVKGLDWMKEKGEEDRRRGWRERWRIRKLTEEEVSDILRRRREEEEEEEKGQQQQRSHTDPPQNSFTGVNDDGEAEREVELVGGDNEKDMAVVVSEQRGVYNSVDQSGEAMDVGGDEDSVESPGERVKKALARLRAEDGVEVGADEAKDAGDGWDVDL